MADFVEGVFLKTVETRYGDIIKVSFDVHKFIDYLNKGEHVHVGDNGITYLNAEIKISKPKDGEEKGKPYMAIDTWKPQSSGRDLTDPKTNPFDKGDDAPF
jgi:hypothetical protein